MNQDTAVYFQSRAGLTPEELKIINSRSIGAVIPLLYSGSMRLWFLHFLEWFLIFSPFWLGIVVASLEDTITNVLLIRSLYFYILPCATLLLTLYRVFFGKHEAWKARKWDSFESFLQTQKKWDKMGVIILVFSGLILLPYYLYSRRYKQDISESLIENSLVPTPTASQAPVEHHPFLENKSKVILGAAEGGYARLAQLVINPPPSQISEFTLKASENPMQGYEVSVGFQQPSDDRDPSSGASRGVTDFKLDEQNQTSLIGGVSHNKLKNNAWTYNLSDQKEIFDLNLLTDRMFLIFYQPEKEKLIAKNQSEQIYKAIHLGLKDSTDNTILLGSYKTSYETIGEDPTTDWEIIEGKSLDFELK